jgi:CBS domain-containing protein
MVGGEMWDRRRGMAPRAGMAKGVPVFREGKLVGIVSRADVVRASAGG